ncbi:uncharacterized protein LOC129914943 [Episyrphus balteatus]|uniref:uncharacterized protein LOC129914943 n=1 Tax=Episyrphus balteatus TaxID=286459 RepID=UPI002486B5D7|nr:uncharacterized protein LOC129914943 [Episyrphus balteatus]
MLQATCNASSWIHLTIVHHMERIYSTLTHSGVHCSPYGNSFAMIRFVILCSVFIGAVSISSHQNSSAISGDEYLKLNQNECFVSHNIGSCFKYRLARILWKLATNNLGYFPNENSRDLTSNATRIIRLVHLSVPSNLLLGVDARQLKDDNEITKLMKFLQRTTELFARSHGIQIEISGEGGTRITSEDDSIMEGRARLSRGDKKKRKWLLILPLIILMKIAHLKMTVVPLLLATLGLNVVLIGGGGWLIHYLKYKTLCKIHPHYIQTQTHVYETDPNDYSTFLGSSDVYSSGNTGSGYNTPHDQGPWNTRKNFHAYGGYRVNDRIN